MRKLGLIGYPLGHSFSKKYFSEKFANENIIDCQYDNYPLTAIEQLPDLIKDNPTLTGLNVTIPYKSSVIKYLDSIEVQAEAVGAVNVLKISRNNEGLTIKGFNSDIDGFRNSISPYLSGRVKNALVLGNGGGAKAVCYVLKELGIKITSVDIEKIEGVITYSDITDELLLNNPLIVNTTPLGMFPNINTCPDINYNSLTRDHILFDLVYNPELTVFLAKGRERGSTIISGIKMLYGQAEKAWEIWNNKNI